MRKRKLKILLHRIRETKELRMVLHIMVRNLSDFSFCFSLSVAYLCAKSGWNYSIFGRGFHLGLLLHGGLPCKHGFLCIPYLFHQLFHFLNIGFIHIACGVHALCYLVQIAADFAKRVVVIPQV